MASDNSSPRSGSIGRGGTVVPLIAISAYTVLAAGVIWRFGDIPTAARVPLALPLLLFAPGYAAIAALYPPSGPGETGSRLERGVLAVVTSIGIVPMVVLATTVVGRIELALILGGIAGFTIVASAVGIARALVGSSETGHPTPDRAPRSDGPRLRHLATDGVTLVAIAITAVLLIASAAVAYSGDGGDQLMTEFYVTNETGTAVDSSPGAIDEGQAAYELGINHHSTESQQYTVVVLLDGNGTSEGSWTELERSSTVVGPDERASLTYRVSRSELDAGSTIRFLLYTGEAPSTPDPDTAHRALALSVDDTSE